MADPNVAVSASGPAANDPESQQFLNLGQYKPEDIAQVSTPTTTTTTIATTNIGNAAQDGHAHPTSAFFTVIFKVSLCIINAISITVVATKIKKAKKKSGLTICL